MLYEVITPMWWWGSNTGWHMGLPNLGHFIAVVPFAILAVAMWSPDYLGHRVFHVITSYSIHYTKLYDIAFTMGADFSFSTPPGLPHFDPMWWWGSDTGWKMGLPNLGHFIAVIPFSILAVAMWSPDYLGHRVFQELNYPEEARAVLMDVDDTMMVASIRQVIGSCLGGGNIASSWGTYMIPAAIAKRPIPGGAILTGIFCVVAGILGYPMDLAMWEPVLRVALIVGVFLPLLEAGMQMVSNHKDRNNFV